ncbi:type I-F CRISPR-associated endoribonuclease Cas6/Csy4 [Pelomicrobium methylotrophicum]|uniref:Type I-F CRISPR-associated endoribonuclease Cas6/Csy4 n=1 Tax=Pelomicrobium methylotrophicum TaxID=2602750 RepID=A0A5C7EHQ3_9PROT|nr:type I-F CRISPR-associated endoribonuclease Cas6/Csy4 [Pelomicrobium methylotrophicum]TXF10353.1 type I-F CRISPR-associated endoribonuclease Cas6/Csy4 [Pelomicrobium methylotrophicum]
MEPSVYLDILVRKGSDVTPHDIISFLTQKLHDARRFGKLALAFPTMGVKPGLGDMIRVFAEEREVLDRVCDFFAEDGRVDDYAIVRHPKHVPENVDGYEAYLQRKFARPLSRSRLERLGERGRMLHRFNLDIREKQRKRAGGLEKYPFVTLYSASSRQQFRLFVQRIEATKEQQGEPGGYGLSRANNIIGLPVFS